MKIIDNFLSDYHADILIDNFNGMRQGGGHFPWYFYNNLNGKSYRGNYYFTSTFINEYNIIDKT